MVFIPINMTNMLIKILTTKILIKYWYKEGTVDAEFVSAKALESMLLTENSAHVWRKTTKLSIWDLPKLSERYKR